MNTNGKTAHPEETDRKKNKGPRLIELYLTFFKLGAFSFGGGYAMLQLIEHEIIDVKGWLKREKIVDIFAVAGALPGAIALNTSAFVGYSLRGLTGSIVAVLGNITPPCIIILLLSLFLQSLGNLPLITSAFAGIRPAVIGLIAYAGYKIGRVSIKDIPGAIITALAFLLSFLFNISLVFLIMAGAITGIIIQTVRKVMASSYSAVPPEEKNPDIIKKGSSETGKTPAGETEHL